MTSKKRGRRRGNNDTRNEILKVARASLATIGFTKTTIRKIADSVGVDVALVLQYFGSKDALFGETLSISPACLEQLAQAVTGPLEGIGERLVRTFLAIWEGEESEPFIAMFRASVANESSAFQLRSFLHSRLVETVGPSLPAIDRRIERVGLAMTMLVGVVVGRRIIGVEAIESLSHETLISMLSSPIQLLLTEEYNA